MALATAGELDARLVVGVVSLVAIDAEAPTAAGAGVYVEGGWAELAGTDVDGVVRTFAGAVGAAGARGVLRAAIATPLTVTIEVRAGWVLAGVEVRSMGARIGGIGGPQLALDIGVALDVPLSAR